MFAEELFANCHLSAKLAKCFSREISCHWYALVTSYCSNNTTSPTPFPSGPNLTITIFISFIISIIISVIIAHYCVSVKFDFAANKYIVECYSMNSTLLHYMYVRQ